MRKPLTLVVPFAIALIAAGCGSSASKPATTSASTSSSASAAPAGGSVKISSASVSGLGTVLVNAQGRTLYVFKPDNAKKVTCTGQCAAIWPPMMVSSGAKPAAGGAVKASLLSSDPDPSGGNVATYNGWPLYAYVTDTGAGSAKGQAIALNGGLWYVMSPSGQPITTKPSSSSGSGVPGY